MIASADKPWGQTTRTNEEYSQGGPGLNWGTVPDKKEKNKWHNDKFTYQSN